MSESQGIRASARGVVAHLRAIARLEKELARAELKRKGALGGAGVGLGVAAGLTALYAVGFGLAAIAAGLAQVVPWWAALLIVFAVLVVAVVVMLLIARNLLRQSQPFKPEGALEEARLTRQAIGGGRGS
jgi:membrane protein implicated in regulation of membrane protease activity